MSRFFGFHLSQPGLDDVRFLLSRDAIPINGDLETQFFTGIEGLTRHDCFADALGVALTYPAAVLCMIRNPSLVLDADLPARIGTAVGQLPPEDAWALAGAGGLGLNDQRHLALYASHQPAIPVPCGPRPLLDVLPDLYLVNAPFARACLSGLDLLPETALEPYLVASGYLQARYSLLLDALSAGIDGSLLPRDLTHLGRELEHLLGETLPDQSISTLSGPIALSEPTHSARTVGSATKPTHIPSLAQATDLTIRQACALPSISIVTRTRFERPALLQRLLTSISRARPENIDLEVILSTDVDPGHAQRELTSLRRAFRNLDLQLSRNTQPGPSRVTNLIGGIEAARHDYVLIVDDDDYLDLFAFDGLEPGFFGGNRPLVICESEVHEEAWEHPADGQPVLSTSTPQRRYPASGWRDLFSGVNQLPVCAMLMPRQALLARLAKHRLTHDLSEDYALFLLLLTDPDLPPIHESGHTLCHISVRGTENSVTMPDRRPWVRDICGHLRGLTGPRGPCAPGVWDLLSGQTVPPASEAAIADLRASLVARDADIRLLQNECRALRAQLSPRLEAVS